MENLRNLVSGGKFKMVQSYTWDNSKHSGKHRIWAIVLHLVLFYHCCIDSSLVIFKSFMYVYIYNYLGLQILGESFKKRHVRVKQNGGT